MASQNIAGRGDVKDLIRPAGRNYYSQIQNTKASNKLDNRLLVSSSSGKAFDSKQPIQSTGGKNTISQMKNADVMQVASTR